MRRTITTLFLPFLVGVSPLLASGVYKPNMEQEQGLQAQQRVIKGRVVDNKGLPLPGASVLVKDYKGGYITNSKGEFEIRTDKASVELTVSFMGFSPKTLTAKAGSTVRVVLEDEVGKIDEVVITGFATKSKNSYTGAQTTIKKADLLSRGTKNLLENLETLVPGMAVVDNNEIGSNPNARPEFNIRGRATFEGKANMPVFIVDGSEVTADYIYDMDINDIENVTVLKDASASALYGAKASAGVIVITTKALEGGRLKLNYSGTARFSMPDLSEYHLLNAAQKLEYERLAGIYTDTQRPSEQYRLDQEYARLYAIVQSGVNTDWLSKPLQNGVSQSHSLSIDGGDTRAKYSVGVRYGNDVGVMRGSVRDRLSGNFKLSYDVPQKFHITNTSTITIVKREESPYGQFSDYVKQNPYEAPYDEQGNLRPLFSSSITNPLYEASVGNFDKGESFDFMNTTNMTLWLGENLRINADFSIQKNKSESQIFLSSKSMSDDMKNITDPSLKGRLRENFSNMLNYQGKVMASYNRYFFDKLYTSTMAGMSMESMSSGSSSYNSVGYYTSKLAHPAFVSRYPVGGSPSGDDAKATGIGFFVNLNGIWDNKYFLDFIYRYEGSSRFGRDERFAPFWSIGGGWNIHNERFFHKSKVLSLLKLRASMGYLGNISFDPYQAMTTYTYTQGLNYTKGMGAVPMTIGNPDLKFRKENVVAATLHVDEETPHIHATVVPIVQGERRKAKEELGYGKRKYKTKKNKVRLCADDVLTPKKLEEYQTTYAQAMTCFGLERGVYGSEAKHRSNMEYYKELLQSTKQKELEETELKHHISNLEKQTGKLRIKGTLYSLFGNSELDEAERRIAQLEEDIEQQRYLREKEKSDIRKEVIALQDTIQSKDKVLAQKQKELKAYEEERSWIQRYLPSSFALLNVRRCLSFMGFSDEQIAGMARTGEAVRAKAKVYSSMYKRYFEEDDATLRIEKDQKQKPLLTINGLSIPDWCEQKWQQLIHRNRSQHL